MRLVTDRTLAFAELHQGTRSSDYTVGALELELTPDGKGTGTRTTRLQADGEQKEATGRDRDLSIPLEAFEPEEVCEKMSRATLRN